MSVDKSTEGVPVHGFSPEEPIAERLYHMFTALATELAVAYERIDTLERLLTRAGILGGDAVEQFVPDEDTAEARRAWRERYIERLFLRLQEEIDAADND